MCCCLPDCLANLELFGYFIDTVEDLRLLVREKEGALEGVKSSSINTLTAKGELTLGCPSRKWK